MMEQIVYWAPTFMLLFAVVVGCVVQRKLEDLRLACARYALLGAAIDRDLELLRKRNVDFMEAIELLNYGAKDEAVDLLKKWGVSVRESD